MFGIQTFQRTLGVAARIACDIPALERKFKIRERVSGPFPEGPCVWMHGASLGECKMLLSLFPFLKKDVPEMPPVVLTTQKAELLDFLKTKEKNLGIQTCMAPLDTPRSMSVFVKCAKPAMLILAENELWPGYLNAMRKISKTPKVALVSGRFRRCADTRNFDAIGFASMQTGSDSTRFVSAGDYLLSHKTIVGGNWKLLSWAKSGVKIACPKNPTVDVAFLSFHWEERKPLLKMLDSTANQGKVAVFAPRYADDLEKFESCFVQNKLKLVTWPEIKPGCVSVVEGYGKLSEVLAESKTSVIGGSFSRTLGVHDFWESLEMGVTTCIGPYSRGQRTAVSALLRDGALIQITSPEKFGKSLSLNPEAAEDFLCREREKVVSSYNAFVEYVRRTLNLEIFR